MAYSLERLEKARRLFPGQAPAVFETGEGYALRSRAKNTTSAISSWIDNDKDDDYLPHQPSRSKRRVPSDRETQSRSRPTKQARSNSTNPRSSREEDTEEDAPSSSSTVTLDDTTGQSKWEELWEPQTKRDPTKAYHFRARKGIAGSPSNTGNDQTRDSTLFEEGKSPTKGCLACQQLELDCSLVDHPFHYPCDSCRDDECDCIPDPPPIWKRPCEPCKSRRRKRCSYLSENHDHSQPCFECVQHGFQCVAGPAKSPPSGVHRYEDTDDTDTETEYEDQDDEPADSSPETSDRHTKGKSRLQGPEKYAPAPAEGRSHSTVSQGSTLEPSDPYSATLAGSGLPPATIPTFGSSSSNPYGAVYRIRTYYPHPLTILDKNSLVSCHWCSNFAYGIVGLGPRDTEILDFGGGRMIEITDGHQCEGKEPSRMCWYCATERLQIMQCQHYDIAPMMHDLDPQTPFSASAAFQDLAQARAALQEPSSQCNGKPFEEADHEWCSLCQRPASWSCNSNQTFLADALGNVHQQMGPIDIGCGLVLCDYCAQTVKWFHGDLDRAAAWGKQDLQNKTEFRADVDYILKHSSFNYLRRQIYRS